MTLPVPNSETFDKYKIIDNKPFSTHLTKFLNSKSDDGYVLNLNAEWGAGKTTFLQCWYNELSKTHPVVYFDAWQSDFSKDAMLALVDCFQGQLKNPRSDNKKFAKGLLDKSSHFIRKAAPAMAVGYVKHKTGIPGDESLFEDARETLGFDITENECGEALKEVLKSLVEQRQKVEGITEFKSTLEDMAVSLIKSLEDSDTPKACPIYILVDELDRCRPSYAIEVIENIKHFFDTKNFVFIVATDTDQLQHSIKAIYGHNFDAHSYLSRFFHKTVTLPPPSTEQYLKSRLKPIIGDDFSFDAPHILQILVSIFDWHNMTSLREIDKVIQDLELAKSSGKQFKILPLTVLSVLKRLHPKHYINLTKYKEQPYRSNSNSNSNAYNLPSNRNIPPIQFSADAQIGFEQSLHYILQTFFGSSQSTGWEQVVDRNVARYNAENAVMLTANHFCLNPHGQEVSFTDNMKILELAGHFS
ncbi:P-loop NTPase fold protein [Vibrio sp. 10N.222.55.C7]|uniref:KAP family P-loop NTPase fold protein n=1 Tax=Vibrio sp. 10N.222.55.C7 TaxID=3229650 RepID=UPI00354BA907